MTERPLRILALATYPSNAACTRHRLLQYVTELRAHDIALDVRPFISNRVFSGLYKVSRLPVTIGGLLAGAFRRVSNCVSLSSYDAVFVQREAAIIGPPLVEWIAQRRLPIVLDLDDATYITRRSDVFGALTIPLKWPGKTNRLIDWSQHVVCGNPTLASYVERRGRPATILPTIVDVSQVTPRKERAPGELVIGWIGSHSTYPYLQSILPVLRRLAHAHQFSLRVIGAGTAQVTEEGLSIDVRPWRLEREVSDLQSFDIGVYPIPSDEWAEGKSGFKAIQYLSCGIPYVASPVGVVADIGIANRTHLEARNEQEWFEALRKLLVDSALRQRMGSAGRDYAVEHYSVTRAAATLAGILKRVVAERRGRH